MTYNCSSLFNKLKKKKSKQLKSFTVFAVISEQCLRLLQISNDECCSEKNEFSRTVQINCNLCLTILQFCLYFYLIEKNSKENFFFDLNFTN